MSSQSSCQGTRMGYSCELFLLGSLRDCVTLEPLIIQLPSLRDKALPCYSLALEDSPKNSWIKGLIPGLF